MLGLSGSDVREAISLSRDIRKCLEDVRLARDDPKSPFMPIASRFRTGVGMSIEAVIDKIGLLEDAIENVDVDTIAEIDDVIDAVSDFIEAESRMASSPGVGPERNYEVLRCMRAWRRDAGKLAQYLCQLSEVPEK